VWFTAFMHPCVRWQSSSPNPTVGMGLAAKAWPGIVGSESAANRKTAKPPPCLHSQTSHMSNIKVRHCGACNCELLRRSDHDQSGAKAGARDLQRNTHMLHRCIYSVHVWLVWLGVIKTQDLSLVGDTRRPQAAARPNKRGPKSPHGATSHHVCTAFAPTAITAHQLNSAELQLFSKRKKTAQPSPPTFL
jgi:hypothetical protein